MKLLLIGPEVVDIDSVRNFSGVWAYYLRREFLRRGVPLRFAQPAPDPEEYARLGAIADHALALGTRHFDKVPSICLRSLRRKIGGVIAHIHDGETKAPVDVTFTVKATGAQGHVAVGWAGDPELCVPRQSDTELNILVDHPDYVEGRGDITGQTLSSVAEFVRGGSWRKRWASVRVHRIADGGLVPAGAPLERYLRATMPYRQMCAAYGQAHLFMVTHRESVGQAALEAAMAGALPVVPAGYMDVGLLNSVRHHSYDGVIDWRAVLEKIDPTRSCATTAPNSWSAIAERIITCLEARGKSWSRRRA